MKAKTSIIKDNHLFNLDNKLIVDYMAKHLKLSDALVRNPYFIYKLFNIFSINDDCILSIKVYDGVIVIKTHYYEYEIVVNDTNGLTVVIDDISNDYDELYFRLRKIVEIIPSNKEIKIIRHEDSITGSLLTFDCEEIRRLNITSVDELGIVSNVEETRITKALPDGLFRERTTITPCTLVEYNMLLEGYKKQRDCGYKYINRSDINSININKYCNGESRSERRYFDSKEVLEIIDLREVNYNTTGMSNEAILGELIALDVSNRLEAHFANEVSSRIGSSLNRQSIIKPSLKDKKLVSEILTSSKKIKKKTNV